MSEINITPTREYSLIQASKIIGRNRTTILSWINKNNDGLFPVKLKPINHMMAGNKLAYRLKGTDVLKLYVYIYGCNEEI